MVIFDIYLRNNDSKISSIGEFWTDLNSSFFISYNYDLKHAAISKSTRFHYILYRKVIYYKISTMLYRVNIKK